MTTSIIFIYFNTSDNLDIKNGKRKEPEDFIPFDDFKQAIGQLTF